MRPPYWQLLSCSYPTAKIYDKAISHENLMKRKFPFIDANKISSALELDLRSLLVKPTAMVQAFRYACNIIGAEISDNNQVKNIKKHNNIWQIETAKGTLTANHLVNAAGNHADAIAKWRALPCPCV